MTNEDIKRFREFLVGRGLLEVYCTALLDTKTIGYVTSTKLKMSNLLMSLHDWTNTARYYPEITRDEWQTANDLWHHFDSNKTSSGLTGSLKDRKKLVAMLLVKPTKQMLLSYAIRLKD